MRALISTECVVLMVTGQRLKFADEVMQHFLRNPGVSQESIILWKRPLFHASSQFFQICQLRTQHLQQLSHLFRRQVRTLHHFPRSNLYCADPDAASHYWETDDLFEVPPVFTVNASDSPPRHESMHGAVERSLHATKNHLRADGNLSDLQISAHFKSFLRFVRPLRESLDRLPPLRKGERLPTTFVFQPPGKIERPADADNAQFAASERH
jgi:hypothetical protein